MRRWRTLRWPARECAAVSPSSATRFRRLRLPKRAQLYASVVRPARHSINCWRASPHRMPLAPTSASAIQIARCLLLLETRLGELSADPGRGGEKMAGDDG